MKAQQLGSGILLAGGLLMQMASAQADLKYTRETRTGTDPKAPAMMVTTTAIRQNARREETRTSYGTMQMNSVELTLCEKKQRIKLDPKLKIYTVSTLDENGMPVEDVKAANASKGNGGPAGTGKYTMTVNVKDLGEEMIAGFKTRHYMVTNHMKSSGCAGDTDSNSKMEVWVTDIREPMACEVGNGDPARAMAAYTPNCKITFEQLGDKEGYAKAFNGMIVRMKIYTGNGDAATMIQDTTSISQAKIADDSLFTIPDGYKQVSAEEFQQAQTKAMMDAMMAGAGQGNGGNNAGNDGNDGDNGNGDNGAEPAAAEAPAAETPAEEPAEEPKKEEPKKEEKKKKKLKIPGFRF